MKYWAIVVFLLLLVGCDQPAATEQVANVRKNPATSSGVRVIQRSGAAHERGVIYGAQASAAIKQQLAVWEQLIGQELGLSLDSLYEVLSLETGLIVASQQYAADILEELRGVASGAEVDFQHLLTLNLAEETILYFANGYNSCTNVGVANQSETLLGYNLDLPPFFRGASPVLLMDDQQVSYSFPGMIGCGGVNQAFAVTTNSLPTLRLNVQGLPLPFMVRKLLQCATIEAAEAFLLRVPLATPQNLMLTGRKRIVDYECSQRGCMRYLPATPAGAIYHTNFPLVSQDLLDPEAKIEDCSRFAGLREIFDTDSPDAPFSLSEMQALMRSSTAGIFSEETYLTLLTRFPADEQQAISLQFIHGGNPSLRLEL